VWLWVRGAQLAVITKPMVSEERMYQRICKLYSNNATLMRSKAEQYRGSGMLVMKGAL